MHCWALNSRATIVGALFNRTNCTLALIYTEGLLVGEQVDLEYIVTVLDMGASVYSANDRTRSGM
jgi:hypothetical protein